VDMRPTEDMTAVILVVGLEYGDVCVYRTPVAYAQSVHFDLLKRFHAHTSSVNAVHMHTHTHTVTHTTHTNTRILLSLSPAAVALLTKI